jgi:hypothetical protein
MLAKTTANEQTIKKQHENIARTHAACLRLLPKTLRCRDGRSEQSSVGGGASKKQRVMHTEFQFYNYMIVNRSAWKNILGVSCRT